MTIDYQECGLAPYATKASQSRGRLIPEPPSATRTEFQRDRDRIVHSSAFRKMRNKTQVFIESEGDYYRTRLTHSLEVAQIARSLARALGLDEDLTETIALAHDLGHTCFGHAGEEGLDAAMKPFGGFNHNEQTFRILTKLENRYARFDGLNLTWETLEGIVKHNGPIDPSASLPTIRAYNEKWELELTSFAGAEAQVAALSDDIAYNTHDADDGHHAGFFRLEELMELPLFGPAVRKMEKLYPEAASQRMMYEAVREVIGFMVTDVLESTRRNLGEIRPKSVEDIRHAQKTTVVFSDEMLNNIKVLHEFLHVRMYRHTNVNEVCARARKIVRDLFDFYTKQPNCLPSSWADAVKTCGDETTKARAIADYIAGMTDRYALQEHRKLFSADTVI
ncbi:MAG: deoxyguanosinetriphosphate triphosphohydrolase [Bdellovibrionales bacterium]|jgi:dGTPase